MKRRFLLAAALVSLAAVAARGQGTPAQLEAAAAALGTANLRTIQYSGWGSDYVFGQAYDGTSPWPRFNLASYTVSIDFAAPALRDDRRRAQAENPPRGGGFQPLLGEQRQIWAVRGNDAWDMAGEAAVPAPLERDLRTAVNGRTAQIWMTPHGFVKAAMAGRATAHDTTIRGMKKTVVTVTAPGGASLDGVLNDRHLVERIETRLSHPMLGDMLYEAIFEDYADFNGVMFPRHILHREGGYPVLDVTITNVTPNATVTMAVPENIRQAASAGAAPIVPEQLSDGVWMFPGGAKSVAVEFDDHVVLVEAPEGEERALALIEAVGKVIPGKPIRYVVNTHSHFDHASGLRTLAAEGATIVTHEGNVPYYEQIWSRPRTLAPDRLSRSGRTPAIEGVVGSRVFDDGTRRLVLYHYGGNLHNAGMLMVFLPREQILIEADSYTPPASAGDPPGGLAFLGHFLEAVQALRLDVEQVVPIHGRLATMEDVREAVDRFGDAQLWRN